uniref:Proteasome 20S subunit beta 3 n=1 Tax=Moschus moschiferus TaxID=68415 RepID=A0A8C6ECH0_MOSMO
MTDKVAQPIENQNVSEGSASQPIERKQREWLRSEALSRFAGIVAIGGPNTPQSCAQRLKFRLNLYELKEGRQIKPYTLMSMVANLLYEKRFGPYYTEPVIAGLDPKTFQPFICSLDLIGCPMVTDDFVVSGTCTEQMYGMCESLWEPNMDPEHLFETISQAMLNAVDRDAVSGMGVIVHIIEKDKITTRTLKARMD